MSTRRNTGDQAEGVMAEGKHAVCVTFLHTLMLKPCEDKVRVVTN